MQPPQPGFGASVKGVRRVRRTVRQAVVQEHAELGKPQNRLLCAATATQILRAVLEPTITADLARQATRSANYGA